MTSEFRAGILWFSLALLWIVSTILYIPTLGRSTHLREKIMHLWSMDGWIDDGSPVRWF